LKTAPSAMMMFSLVCLIAPPIIIESSSVSPVLGVPPRYLPLGTVMEFTGVVG